MDVKIENALSKYLHEIIVKVVIYARCFVMLFPMFLRINTGMPFISTGN